jgi:hypothetical protein
MLIRNESVCFACLEGYRDRARDAERRRPFTQKPMGQKKGHRKRRALAWLGHRLVSWGRRLEERNCAPCQPLRSG